MRSFTSGVSAFGRVIHPRAALGWGLAALLSASCAQPGSAEQVEAARGALSGAGVTDDVDSPEANVVVDLEAADGGRCSGTLLTPQIVITAAHCIWGGDSGVCNADAVPIQTVWIGPRGPASGESKDDDRPAFGTVAFDAAAGCPQPRGSDVAVIYLNEPVTQASMAAKVKPGVALPAVPRIYPATFLSPGGALFGVAGFGLPLTDRRRVKLFESDGLEQHRDGAGNSYWEIDIGDWQIEDGDSGGPLFTVNPDGTRHLVGVVRGTASSGIMIFPDLTRSGMDEWVRGRITEGNVPPHLRHSDAWLEQHGKDRGSWWGQLDYDVVPCDEAGDPDCDGWFSHHDNCPSIANADQADGNDDGIGDTCAGLASADEIGDYAGVEAVPDATDPTVPADEIGGYAGVEAVPDATDPTVPADEIGDYAGVEAVPGATDPTVPAGDIDLYGQAYVVPAPPVPPPPPPSPVGTLGSGSRSGVFWRAFR